MTAHTRLVVVGQGSVGLPLAMRAVSVGFSVVGLDLDAVRIWALKEGRSYVDDVGDGEVCQALATGRFLPTVSYEDAEAFDAAIITVPPRDAAGDVSSVESAVEGIAPHLRPGTTVVLESPCYPGTTEEVVVPLLEKGSGLSAGTDFFVGYSPERIDQSNPKWTLANTPKIVSGVDARSLAAVKELYEALVERTVPVASTRVAELAKLLEDSFRQVNTALINEIAMFAHQLGVDVWDAIEAASTKPFGFLRFQPGPGVAGPGLPAEDLPVWQARRELGREFRLRMVANDINAHMPDYVVRRLTAALNRRRKAVRGSLIVLLGLTCQPNTSGIRQSPALRVCELLAEQGALIRVVDSHVEAHRCPPMLDLVELSESCLRSADAVVLLTDHDDIDYDLVERASGLVLDTRHRLRGSQVEYL